MTDSPLTISKTVISFTVLHRTDEPIEDLQDALSRSFDGHAVGLETAQNTEQIADFQVADELIALGNDGEFFDHDLGLVDD